MKKPKASFYIIAVIIIAALTAILTSCTAPNASQTPIPVPYNIEGERPQ